MSEETRAISHEKRVELKYMLDLRLAGEVKQWAREHLGFDPHCGDATGEYYDVHTLYLDTPLLDLYHRTGIVGRAKHRVRRYGDQPLVWLETKRKKKSVVFKNRTAVPGDELQQQLVTLASATPQVDQPWCGQWFLDRLSQYQLQPTVQIRYRRFVRTAIIAGHHLRLTIDSDLRGCRADGWGQSLHADMLPIDAPRILELKFYDHMPHLFKELLRTFAIPATGFSKYRTAVDANSLALGGSDRSGADSDPDASAAAHAAGLTECARCA